MIEYFQHPRFAPFSLEHDDADVDRTGVMLVHGFTGTPADMRPLAEMLFARGCNCHGILLPGMGPDIARLSTSTASGWRRSVLDAWREHTSRYRRTVLIGYSMGGAAAIQMAAEHPPDVVLLLAPFWKINDARAPFLPLLKHLMSDIQFFADADLDDPGVRDWFRVALPDADLDDPAIRRAVREETAISPPAIDELRKFGRIARRDASGVRAPVAVIQGHEDTVVNPRDTRELIGRFPVFQAYHEISGDHLIALEGSPQWLHVCDLMLRELAHVGVEADPD